MNETLIIMAYVLLTNIGTYIITRALYKDRHKNTQEAFSVGYRAGESNGRKIPHDPLVDMGYWKEEKTTTTTEYPAGTPRDEIISNGCPTCGADGPGGGNA